MRKKLLTKYARVSIIAFVFNTYARVAQLVEHDLAKVGAAGSSPVSRSFLFLVKPLQHETLQGFSLCKRNYMIE